MRSLLSESSFQVEMLTEQTESGKKLFIEGIFAQAEKVNGNKRMYMRDIMESAVGSYQTDYVSKRRALGELNHPDRPFADPKEAAILIESLKWDGDNVIGKAQVLTSPNGMIVKSLLEAGFNLGVSTRGLGSLKEQNGIKYVQKDFFMTAIDAVDNPSGPDCYVNALHESKFWALNESGIWAPVEEKPKLDESLFLTRLEDYIKSLKQTRR